MEIRLVEDAVISADRWTNMANLTGDFRDHANALLKFLILLDTITTLQPPVPTHYHHSLRHKEEKFSML